MQHNRTLHERLVACEEELQSFCVDEDAEKARLASISAELDAIEAEIERIRMAA